LLEEDIVMKCRMTGQLYPSTFLAFFRLSTPTEEANAKFKSVKRSNDFYAPSALPFDGIDVP
jgi:hypothetical protein